MPDATIERLNLEVTTNADGAATAVDKLATSVGNLGLAINSNTLGALTKLNTQLATLKSTVPGIAPGVSSLSTSMKRLTQSTAGLGGTAKNMGAVQQNAKSLAAMAPAASNAANATNNYIKTTKTGAVSITSFTSKLYGALGVLYLIKRAFSAVMQIFDATTGRYSDLIEATNLFQVAMRNVLPQAEKFVQTMSQGIGMDPKDLMQFQGIFYQINRSMGVTSDKAYQMSEGLTQLSYDFASLRNMEPDYVFTKLKGAIVGEARAMRELGVDITQAALQEEAHRLGISKKVKEMTQHEKALLRYNVIMRNSTDAQGDMARTLDQPANMMRILRAQVEQLARAFGALLIPALQATLPWLIYIANAALNAMNSLLKTLGITMPEFKMPNTDVAYDLGDGFEDATDKVKGTTKAIKKLKDYTLGIDELNILKPPEPSSGAGGGAGKGGGGGNANIPLPPTYDFFKDMKEPFDKLINGIKEKLEPFMAWLRPILKTWGENFRNLWGVLKPILAAIGKFVGILWEKYLKPVLGYILVNWDKTWDVVVGVLKVVWEIIKPFVGWMLKRFSKFGDVFKATMEKLTGKLKAKDITGFFDKVAASIKNFYAKVGKLFKKIRKLWATTAVKLKKAWGPLKEDLIDMWDKVKKSFTDFIDGAKDKWQSFLDKCNEVKEKITTFIDDIALIWEDLSIGDVSFLVDFTMNGWEDTKAAWDTAVGWVDDKSTKTITGAKTYWDDTIVPAWNSAVAWVDDYSKKVIEGNKIMWDDYIVPAWNSAKSWVNDTVQKSIEGYKASGWSGMWDAWESAMGWDSDTVKKTVTGATTDAFRSIESRWADLKSKTVALGISIKAGALSLLSSLIKGYNKLAAAIAAYTHTTGYAFKGPDGLYGIPLSSPHMKFMAKGGQAEAGQMFVAGEAGPELIGSYAGNKNTVMPLENSGFVEAMAKSVFQAVSSAMATNQSGGTGDIYMDGEKVGAVVRRGERRNGATGTLIVRSV